MDSVRDSAFRLVPQVLIAAIALGCSAVSARPTSWPPLGAADVMRDSVRVQVTRTMALDLPAPVDRAFPLFGPVREAEWSPGWQPTFIAPTVARQTPDGAVFTTANPQGAVVWVMTDYDSVQHLVRYVHMAPGRVLAQLWIEVHAATPQTSAANVTFRYTSLGPDGSAVLDHFVEAFPAFKTHWEEAMSAALTQGAPPVQSHHHGLH